MQYSFLFIDDNMYVFTSHSNYRKMYLSTMDRTSLVFNVRAAHDASIALSFLPANLDIQTAEVVIGADDNTRTVIRKEINGTEVASVASEHILSGADFMPFWVTWSGSEISVGKGDIPGQDAVLTHPVAESLVISTLAITTSGSYRADWHIPYASSDGGMCVTPGKHETFTHCWYNVGPSSMTLAQHCTNIG